MNFINALYYGIFAGIVALILGVLTHFVYPPYGFDSVIGLSLGVTFGNFMGHFIRNKYFPR